MAAISFPGNNHGLQIGDNHGSISAEFHLPPERPETPPDPLSTVPFIRDRDFVSRGTLLSQLHEKSLVPGSRTALVGLGGVGKSQLAIEYSYWIRSESPATWVFWVHASNAARFEQSFRDLAEQIKIPGRQDPQVHIFTLVENWLRDKKRRWLLILDNVDDHGFLRKSPAIGQADPENIPTNASTKPLLEYLPRSLNGSIIITSRTREVALQMVDYKDLIVVDPMERSEALELLQRKLDQPGESQECRELVDELEYIPLAILQAASYIRCRVPRYSVSQYLTDFLKSDREATRLLQDEAGHLYRDWEANSSILSTWQLSYAHIRQIRPSAADLLSLMSFFDRQAIPENLLQMESESASISGSHVLNGTKDNEETTRSGLVPDFEADIITLRGYSLISVNENKTSFAMHRLVQLTMRVWLEAHGQLQRWKKISIANLCREFPTGEYENWGKCRVLFPHIKSVLSQRPEGKASMLEWATILYRAAWFSWQSGNFTDARELASKSMEARLLILGPEGHETLDSTAMLARAYLLEGQWEEAEKLLSKVIETRRMKLGEDHPDTLSSLAYLASTHMKQGRFGLAEKLLVQVTETRTRKLGLDHPDTLSSIVNLASTHRNQGKLDKAKRLLMQVISTRKRKLGEDHPDTLSGISNLASIYRKQGLLEESEELLNQVVETSKVKLGEDHPGTLLSMANLSSTLKKLGRWEKAEQLEVQVMEARKTKIGENHPSTLTSMANLASTYRNQGRWDEAEQIFVQVMDIRKASFGECHPDTLRTLDNLALTYMGQGRLEEAEALQAHVKEMCNSKLVEDHPDSQAEALLE